MKLEIDSVTYHLNVSGDGFPFLLLHGFTGDSTTWQPFFSEWGKHSQLIAPDIVGHGQSDSPADISRYDIQHAASDLKLLLEQLGINQLDVLGYSMGGRLALTFAIMFPMMVRNLILESASPGLETEEERKARRMKDAELAHFIKERGIEEFVSDWERIPLFQSMSNQPEEVRLQIRKQRLENCPEGLANSLLGMGTGSQPSWWKYLKELTCPVLLLTGKQDTKFCEIARSMQGVIPKSTWMIFHDSGHAIHVEEKEKFGTIVSDFLTKGGVSF